MEETVVKSADLSAIQLVSSEQLSDSFIGVKSLVWSDEDSLPYMLVLAIERKVSTEKLLTAFSKSLRMSDRETAELLTRQRIGSISPLGHDTKFRIIVDLQLLEHAGTSQWVAVGSGIEGSSYCLTIEKLITLTNAEVIDISVEDQFMKARAVAVKNRSSSSSQAIVGRSDFACLQFTPQLLRKLAISSDTVKLIATIDAAKRVDFAQGYSFPKHFTLKDHLDLPSKVGGKTALHLAAWKGPIESVRVLIEHGASVNQYSTNIGNYGKTALFYAITQCRDAMVLELLRHNALVIIVNNKGQTPRSLGVSHLKEETLLAIEAAERKQLIASNNEFMNFYETHRDHEGSYGDLDPRFVDEAKELRDNFTNFDDLPKSILMTTVTTRRGKHNAPNDATKNIEHHSRTEHFLSTFSPHFADYPDEGRLANITNIIHPVINSTVELKAMIIAKRQISKFLVFVNICPINLTNFSSFLGMRYSWQDDFGHDTRDIYAIQLIIGKSLKNILGEDLLSALCKYIKEGQKVYIRGEIRAITLGKRPLPSQVLYSQNESFVQADNLREIDLAVTQLLFLDDCTPSNGAILDNQSIVSSGTSSSITTFSSGTTTAVVEALKKMKKNESRLAHQDEDEFDFGVHVTTRLPDDNGDEYDNYEEETAEANNGNASQQSAVPELAPILPFLQLEDYANSLQLSSVSSTHAAAIGQSYDATVTLVNDHRSLDHFLAVLQSLLLPPSQSSSLPTAVMGIDCEWQPEGLYDHHHKGGSSDPSHHHYVQTLQIGTKFGLFILDMSVLTHDVKFAMKLNTALEQVLQDENIWKIGYDCRHDFERLAASFPTFTCFQRILTVIDLQPLARQLYPGKVLKRDLGLSRLCAVLLGKVLNKSQQCSPWHIRPLTAKQITYAALDVASLMMLFDKMSVDYQYGALSSLISGKRKNRLTLEEETFTMLLKRLSMVFNLKYAIQEINEQTRNTLDEKVLKQSNMRLLFDRLLRFKKWTAHAGAEPNLPPVVDMNEYLQLRQLSNASSNSNHSDNNNGNQRRSWSSKQRQQAAASAATQQNNDGPAVVEDLSTRSWLTSIGQYVGKTKQDCRDFICNHLHTHLITQHDRDKASIDRGGYLSINGNNYLFFVNLLGHNDGNGNGGPVKYPNEFLRNGSEFTYFAANKDALRILGKFSPSSRALVNNSSSSSSSSSSSIMATRSKVKPENRFYHLFIRRTFMYCGTCNPIAVRQHENNQVCITFQLLYFDSAVSLSNNREYQRITEQHMKEMQEKVKKYQRTIRQSYREGDVDDLID